MVSENSRTNHSEDRSSSSNGPAHADYTARGAHSRVPSDADELDDQLDGEAGDQVEDRPGAQESDFEGAFDEDDEASSSDSPFVSDFPDDQASAAFAGDYGAASVAAGEAVSEGVASEAAALDGGEEMVPSLGDEDLSYAEGESYPEGASYVNLESSYVDGEVVYSSVDSTDPQPAVVGQYSRDNPHYSKASAKKGRGKKVALYVLIAVFIVLVGCGSALAYWVNSINDELTDSDLSDEELSELADLLSSDTDFSEPFYVMLIGSDARSDDASMGARSDTNIVVRVDLEEGIITLISIPRDTQIELEDYGTVKFNAAYAYGGAALVIEQANELLGIEISHYAEIDFEGLVDLVDAVGGVTVYVESEIDDSKAGDVVIEEGYQTLDGEAALVYARSRQYVDGDFTRTSHQRTLITAIVEKVLSLSVTELPSVVQAAAECVTTDLSFSEILQLVMACQELDDLTIYSCMVPSTTGTEDGISYVYTDFETLEEMMEAVEAGEDPSGYEGTYSSSSSDDDEEEEEEDEDEDSSYSYTYSSSNDSASSSGSNSSSGTDSSASSSSSSTDSSASSSSSSSSSAGSADASSSGTGSSSSAGSTDASSSGTGSSSGSSGTTSSDSSSSGSSSDASDASSSGSSSSSSDSSGSTSSDTSSSDTSSSSGTSSSDSSSSSGSGSGSSDSSSSSSSGTSSSESSSSSSSSSSDSSSSSGSTSSDSTSTSDSSSATTDTTSATS